MPTDTNGCMVADAMPELDDSTIVILQAGNVNTGHSDPFTEIVPRANRAGAWVHVDGAFGLWSAADPARRHLVAGVEDAEGRVFSGCNVENASYSLTICAERVALFKAVSEGAGPIVRVALVADGDERPRVGQLDGFHVYQVDPVQGVRRQEGLHQVVSAYLAGVQVGAERPRLDAVKPFLHQRGAVEVEEYVVITGIVGIVQATGDLRGQGGDGTGNRRDI